MSRFKIDPLNSNSRVSYYVHKNTLYFGVENKMFKCKITPEKTHNTKVYLYSETPGILNDVRISDPRDVQEIAQSAVANLISQEYNLRTDDPDYIEKRYVWDNDDCVHIKTEDIQISDILYDEEYGAVFLVTAMTEKVAHLLCTATSVEYEFELHRLSNFQPYRVANLWR